MIITWEEHELAELVRQTKDTKYSTGEVAERLSAIYEANIEQDIADAIKDLEEEL